MTIAEQLGEGKKIAEQPAQSEKSFLTAFRPKSPRNMLAFNAL